MKKVYRHVFGWFFMLLGIIGLFLPVLQGVLFLFIGALILAPEVPFFHRIIEDLKKRHPHIFDRAKNLLNRVQAFFRKKNHRGDILL
ncbi:MAG TPA: PGPGW domain-containing protein [Syntrophales bacterium]|nr:PGPGW domain-containing protein [Syntrophales bacterium]